MKYNLIINISSSDKNMIKWEMGEKLLFPLFATNPLKPMRISNLGEVTSKTGIDIESLVDCEKLWASKTFSRSGGLSWEGNASFFWRRTKTCKSAGMINFPFQNLKGNEIEGGILFESAFNKKVNWYQLFKDWCVQTNSNFGSLVPNTEAEYEFRTNLDLSNNEIERTAWSRFLSGNLYAEFRAGELNSLVSGFTSLGWASWFGSQFASEVDYDKISAAGFPIEKIGDGYLICVTESISDVFDNFPMFLMKRAELKKRFKDNLFLIK